MNSQELKEVLKSKGNKLAIAALHLIESGGALEDLQKLVAEGCNHTYVERDSSHPRSRFRTRHVIDACFDTHFGVVKQTQGEGVTTTVLGEVHKSEGREAYFQFLLDAGFTPGRNGYRGELFDGILFECFKCDETSEVGRRERAITFARMLIASGRFDIQRFACKSYYWVGSLDKLDTILSFGANPEGPGMIDEALSFIACAANSGETDRSRVDVINRLLELGATPKEQIRANDKRFRIETYGLLEKLAAFGVISIEQSSEYLAFLVRRELTNPMALAAPV
jgi:hypothetical protein